MTENILLWASTVLILFGLVYLLRKQALHWKILVAMVAGLLFGYVVVQYGRQDFILEVLEPIGRVFVNLLRMIAVPLVLFSLVAGAASLDDTSKMGRIGGKTILLYVGTTAIAIAIGLVVVNLIQPGATLAENPELRDQLASQFQEQAVEKSSKAEDLSFVDQIVGIVPKNPFEALSSSQMLQIVFFALMLGIALTRLPRERAKPVIHVFQTLSDAIIVMVQGIMKIAPVGVFALIATVLATLGEDRELMGQLLQSLGLYMLCVVLGLGGHMMLVYASLVRFLTKVPLRQFFRAMVPAQLLAFSSSSSAATLPVTIDCVEKGIGVDEEVSSFVLPLGATINMDGTGLYQGVAAVFIAQVFGRDLGLSEQLTIVLTATMASIGTAAVPGVGVIMLTIVLQQLGMATELAVGIGLILGVDRPLDMCRTVTNVTGDAAVATVVASSEGSINLERRTPKPRPDGDSGQPSWDDSPAEVHPAEVHPAEDHAEGSPGEEGGGV